MLVVLSRFVHIPKTSFLVCEALRGQNCLFGLFCYLQDHQTFPEQIGNFTLCNYCGNKDTICCILIGPDVHPNPIKGNREKNFILIPCLLEKKLALLRYHIYSRNVYHNPPMKHGNLHNGPVYISVFCLDWMKTTRGYSNNNFSSHTLMERWKNLIDLCFFNQRITLRNY